MDTLIDNLKLCKDIWGKSGIVKVLNTEESTEVAILNKPDQTYVVFHPTNSDIDWEQNLDFFYQPMRVGGTYVKVHRGYLQKLDKVYQDVIKEIKKDTVTFMGISQGASMAQLTALKYKMQYRYRTVRCFAYSGSRVGNRRFVRVCNAMLDYNIRSYYGDDPVTALPPLILGFRHAGPVVRVRRDKAIVDYDRPVWEDFSILMRLLSAKLFGTTSPFPDHGYDNLYNGLKNGWVLRS